MATASFVRLEVNQPATGTVKFLAYYAERENPNKPGTTFAAQWVLTGSWRWVDAGTGEEVTADGKIGIDEYHLDLSPVAMGLGVQDGTWDDGNPKYKWTHRGPIRLVKTAQGKKHHVTIQRLDQNGQPIAAPTAAGAVSPPPAASSRTPTAAATAGTGSSPRAVPASVPLTSQDREEWASLARTYKRCVLIAADAWGVDPADPGSDTLIPATAALFIEANKRGLTVPAPVEKLTPEQKAEVIRDTIEKYAEKPAAIGSDDDDLPF
jgi:hypothetical protein